MPEVSTLCDCGSGKEFSDCCGPYLRGAETARSAEALMRSRYTAYVQGNVPYILSTWHSTTRPEHLSLQGNQPDRWLGLKVLTSEGGPQDQQGRVEFVARYKVNGKAGRLHELGEFVREAGRWFYVKGTLIE